MKLKITFVIFLQFFEIFTLCLHNGLALKSNTNRYSSNGRIVNGIKARIEDFPFQLSLRRYNQHICGAAVLNANWAITAAHCIDGMEFIPQMFSLRMGSAKRLYGGQVLAIDKIYKHPNYDHDTVHCDVALLRTNFNRQKRMPVTSINLPYASASLPVGTEAIISGWGHMSAKSNILSNSLRYAKVNIVDQQECENRLKPYGQITDAMFCAAAHKTDACQGDSGGPIQVKGTLVGVVSWGIGCADSLYPGVYTRLAYPTIRRWIALITKL